jgi:hypothetical protein
VCDLTVSSCCCCCCRAALLCFAEWSAFFLLLSVKAEAGSVELQRDRAVIHELHGHQSTEFAVLHALSAVLLPDPSHEGRIQLLRSEHSERQRGRREAKESPTPRLRCELPTVCDLGCSRLHGLVEVRLVALELCMQRELTDQQQLVAE